MSVGRVICGALLCALPLACGERAGDAVVALSTDGDVHGGSAGEGPGGFFDPGRRDGPTGLCGACSNSLECGDANDACVRGDEGAFCGRDCEDQRGCPDGYECVELEGNRLRQCVAQAGCREPTASPALAQVREYLLARINSERAARDRPSLQASPCLDDLAQDSALAFARTDEPQGKFVKECDPLWPLCTCGWFAEAEIAVAQYELDWTSAIDRIVDTRRPGAEDRFVQAFLDRDLTSIGIGFWLSGDEAWIALSFG